MRATAVRPGMTTSATAGGGPPLNDADLIRELELLSLQLPAAATEDRDRDDIVALRADIMELITAITIGLSDAD